MESLLDADEVILRQIEEPPFPLLASSPIDFAAGDRIGPYRVERELGRGGIGTVYLATRADGVYTTQVAVKVLKRGMDSDEIVRRFRTERQILANLNHPNIAELYDGGTTADHRPYLVMEYVDGEPIDLYCDHRRLGIEGRLRLFLEVCSAVERAHRSLVIHRDLKPGNILVDAEGKPKLLDFGIAKLLEPSSLQESTATGLRPMTPHYASPEQAQGEPVTTASDVYSLGVLLYELLSGRSPYRPASGEAERLRTICEEDPPHLGQVVTQEPHAEPGRQGSPATAARLSRARGLDPARLAKRLAGDLDHIVRRALRKEPEHRYSSVEAFAQDIRRHLRGLPVLARRRTLLYSTGKLLERRKKELAAATLAGALLGVFLLDRHEQQQRRAHERDRAVQVSTFLGDLFAISDLREAKGADLTMREVLDHGAERIARELEDDPELKVDLLMRISEGYHALGLFDSALPLQEEAVQLIRRLRGHRHPEVAEVLMGLASTYGNVGRYGEAEAGLREVLEIHRYASGEDSDETVSATNALAAALLDQGRYAEAEPLFRRSLAAIRRTRGERNRSAAAVMGNLGVLLYLRGSYEESERHLRAALSISTSLLGAEDPMASSHRYHLGNLLRLEGRHEEAEEALLAVLETYRRKLGEHPAVARTLHTLAELRREQGRLAEAESRGEEALELRRRFRGESHPAFADSLLGQAETLIARGEHEEAEEKARKALAIYRQTLPESNWRPAHGRSVLAACLAARGKPAEARALLEAASQVLAEHRGERSPEARRARARLEALGEPPEQLS